LLLRGFRVSHTLYSSLFKNEKEVWSLLRSRPLSQNVCELFSCSLGLRCGVVNDFRAAGDGVIDRIFHGVARRANRSLAGVSEKVNPTDS